MYSGAVAVAVATARYGYGRATWTSCIPHESLSHRLQDHSGGGDDSREGLSISSL